MTFTTPQAPKALMQYGRESEARPRPNANILLVSTHVCHLNMNLDAKDLYLQGYSLVIFLALSK